MFLKSLMIESEGQLIREINFHKGLNLIVDETPTSDRQSTGNNVGKTTVLMLVDFCLGADAKQIYTDPEDKKQEYKLVKDFLISRRVVVTLTLKEDLDQPESREIVIERNFLARKNKVQRVDGIDKTDDEFEEALTDILFPGHYPRKPTFRQIVSHNIRYSDQSVSNTLKTLSVFTRADEYETLYLFLLGCDFDQGDSKQLLRSQIRIEETFKTRLERHQTRSAYEAALAILNGEIETLERRKSTFNLNEDFEHDLDTLNQVKYQINLISADVTKLTIRRSLILEAQADLQTSVSSIDLKQLEQIYQQAKAQIGNLQKTFAELQQFHNQMVAEKIKYITKDLPRLDAEIQAKNAQLQRLLQEEARLGASIVRGNSFGELEKLIADLNELFRKKGEYENIIQQLKTVEANLQELNQQLAGIDDTLFSELSEQRIKNQVNKFNRHFAAISKDLYGEQYALKYEIKVERKSGKRLYEFSAFNTNFSSGKKQGEISCFDIAYTLFADQEGIPCMHFLLNDKKELMHDNQLLKIGHLVSDKGIQFIASILRDKLPPELNRDAFIVLKLSQADKLFRIETLQRPAA